METKTLDELEDDELRDYLLPLLVLYGIGKTIPTSEIKGLYDPLFYRAWARGFIFYNQITAKGMNFIEAGKNGSLRTDI